MAKGKKEIFWCAVDFIEFGITVNGIKNKNLDTGGMAGYLPVYHTKKVAEKNHPGKEILKLETTRDK
ncbi:MAG: hypothetical protein KAX20_07000 [Candidatus Omnitrophica bacterium]|nr:hypothetical protein [Candidatus Omnitrophota bacterium]